MLSKTVVLPKEASNNYISNNICNHITSSYRKHNLPMLKIELEALINLTKGTRNLLQILYPNV